MLILTFEHFLTTLSKPANRALQHHGIDSFEKLAALTEKEVLNFHGVGPASLPLLTHGLAQANLSIKK
ncbi:hypothetical protein I6N95_19525 [Vagococcus sp. BWB3-3]|uniref:RNA polymerase alpha subunit C-terminal domain-containing protein n=1 Tax=Vagococcus allomyrinae TaxID=2794353 RepID=A0A940SWP3_9ENTE|nr:hypothetical protein [Vagococcus allomyrinae]